MSSIHQKTLGDKIRLTKQRVVVVVYIAPHSKISVETFQVQLKALYINKLWKKMCIPCSSGYLEIVILKTDLGLVWLLSQCTDAVY